MCGVEEGCDEPCVGFREEAVHAEGIGFVELEFVDLGEEILR